MRNHSVGLAVLISAAIAVATTLLMAVLGNLTVQSLLILFAIVFFAACAGIYLALERIVFRRLERLNAIMNEFGDNGEAGAEEPDESDPVEWTARQLKAFAAAKQREIDRLRKQEAFRKNFIADISHELKTPIFAAQGFVHTLLDGALKEKAVRKKFLKKAAKSLDGIDLLVQDLLTLANIESGEIKMRLRELDLYALTMDVFDQFKGKSNKKEIQLRIEGPVRKVLVYADWQRISQVMTNLVSNAINHSEEGGEVVVSFAIRKKSVVTKVRDFGAGIPGEHIQHIFERFYRVDKSRARGKGGTGLGLAIVKHILEGHHSRPEVESSPGKGSTFHFKLARTPEETIDNGEHQEPATA